MHMLANLLFTHKSSADKVEKTKLVKFINETMLYVPEMTSSEGLQSVIDFINHAPAQTHLEIFTLVANEDNIATV